MSPNLPDRFSRPCRAGGRDLLVRMPDLRQPAEGESDLLARGVVVPIDHRSDWARAVGSPHRVMEIWSEAPPRCECSVIVAVGQSRAMPRHESWRVERLGVAQEPEAVEAVLAGLLILSSERRVLSVSVGLSTADSAVRQQMASCAKALGYRRASRPQSYEWTSRIDLTGDLDDISAALHASCRRGIRATSRGPLEVGLIADPSLAGRLESLHEETMARTGGGRQAISWEGVIEYAAAYPDRARLVGTFSTEATERVLLAYALGLRQGDHVEYRMAGSTRFGPRAPLGYAPAWNLIEWAKKTGAQWFDFGGLPTGRVPDELAGIVRFKESFGGEPMRVREEWVLSSRPLLESVRRGLSRAAGLVRRLSR